MLTTRRAVLFLLGCIPARLAIAVASRSLPATWLRALALPFLAVALGFWAIFVFGWRATGIETGGERIWWNALRPVHGTLWAVAAYMALKGERERVFSILLTDACLGLVAFTVYHVAFRCQS